MLLAPENTISQEGEVVMAMNCWEFKKCGREGNGIKTTELGVCPAFPTHGRHCARVAGTLCGGVVQGLFATKLANCLKCDYYNSEHYDRSYGKNY